MDSLARSQNDHYNECGRNVCSAYTSVESVGGDGIVGGVGWAGRAGGDPPLFTTVGITGCGSSGEAMSGRCLFDGTTILAYRDC